MRLLAVLACSLAVTAAASATAPVAKHTASGNTAAKSSLLTVAILGKGWKSSGANTSGLVLTCPGYQPSGKGIVETGVASTGSLSTSTIGPFVSQATSLYATTGQAAKYWARAVKPGLIKCIAQTVEAIGAQGVKVSITKQGSPAAREGRRHDERLSRRRHAELGQAPLQAAALLRRDRPRPGEDALRDHDQLDRLACLRRRSRRPSRRSSRASSAHRPPKRSAASRPTLLGTLRRFSAGPQAARGAGSGDAGTSL